MRQPDDPLEQRHKDIAASVQRVTEDVMLQMATYVGKETGSRNLCLAGGVALNCVANGRILREGPFDHIFVQLADAYRCFMKTGMDYLVLGNCLLDKRQPLPRIESINWDQTFEPD